MNFFNLNQLQIQILQIQYSPFHYLIVLWKILDFKILRDLVWCGWMFQSLGQKILFKTSFLTFLPIRNLINLYFFWIGLLAGLNLLTFIREVGNFNNNSCSKFRSHCKKTFMLFSANFKFFWVNLLWRASRLKENKLAYKVTLLKFSFP